MLKEIAGSTNVLVETFAVIVKLILIAKVIVPAPTVIALGIQTAGDATSTNVSMVIPAAINVEKITIAKVIVFAST